MNSDIRKIAGWARDQGWTVSEDSKGYTRFYSPNGDYVCCYPATPSNPRRRMADLCTNLRRAGLQVPPPSKKEQRAERRELAERREEAGHDVVGEVHVRRGW